MNKDAIDNCIHETRKHILRVRGLLGLVVDNLDRRAAEHDASKLEEPELSVFAENTHKLKGITYGSDEYKSCLAEMKPALDHHYANNSHHPEFYRWHCPICNGQYSAAEHEDSPQGPNDSGVRYCRSCCRFGMIYESELMEKPELGIRGMSLLDLIEMIADWKAASERHSDGDVRKSIEINQKRFGYSNDLKAVFFRTVDELFPHDSEQKGDE